MTHPLITFPTEVHTALAAGADLLISISGGKDSQAMFESLAPAFKAQGFTGQIIAIHADLGRMEWQQSIQMCQDQADRLGISLVVVSRDQGDLLDQIKDRKDKLAGTGQPFWPSPSARYCTSDQKRDQINKYIRATHNHVVVAIGFRAAESSARAKKLPCSLNTRISGAAVKREGIAATESWDDSMGRLALTWYPILEWSEADVWQGCGTSTAEVTELRAAYAAGDHSAADQLDLHPAYIFGNDRVSCALCIMGSKNDLINGAQHNPIIFSELLTLESDSGFTFQSNRSLASIDQIIKGVE